MSWKRLIAAWGLLAVAMTVNGIGRELVIRPAIGEGAAQIVSAVLGAAIIVGITRAMFVALGGAPARRLAAMSAVMVALTVAFEFAVGVGVDRKPVSALLANYAFWRGELWPWLLLLVALTPFLWGRWFPSEVHRAH